MELWRPVTAALDRAGARGIPVQLWLRDDDAIDPSPALDRLTRLAETHRMPVLLAVIPAGATPALVDHVAAHALLTPTQHGFSHTNHAAPGERAREIGGPRSLSAVLDDLRRGRDRIAAMFGDRSARILVPPWNRIDDAVLPDLPGLGYTGLSTFGPPVATIPGLAQLNTDLDIIDWRNGRVGRAPEKLVGRLSVLIDEAVDSRRPIGLLTHHLAHDATAWSFLDTCLGYLAAHPAARFVAAVDLLAQPTDAG